MKTFPLFIILLVSGIKIFAQSLFGTPLIEGSVSLQIEATRERYCQGVLSEKSETKETYSSQLTGKVYLNKNEISLIRMWNKRGGIAGGNNRDKSGHGQLYGNLSQRDRLF